VASSVQSALHQVGVASGAGAMILALDPRGRPLAEVCCNVPDLALSALGEEAVTIGAVEIARDHLRDTLFSAGAAPGRRPTP